MNSVGQVDPKDCYLSRKYSGMQGRDIQVVKPYKCGWRGPAGHFTNVWNGHPAGPYPMRMAIPLVEWALTQMEYCSPKEEYAKVIASTNHLEILCFVAGPPLVWLPKPTKKLFWLSVWGRTLNVYFQGPDGAEQGFLAARRGGKHGMRYDLGSERSWEHLRYKIQPWFQVQVFRPEFQASKVDGKGLHVSYSFDLCQC